MTQKIPNVDTLSCLIDRLIIEVIKIAYCENKKCEERAKEKPNLEYIGKLDGIMRPASESRSAIKNKIDELLKESIDNNKYDYIKETRTF